MKGVGVGLHSCLLCFSVVLSHITQCPFYRELQVNNECGRHACNCLLGGPYLAHDDMEDLYIRMVVAQPAFARVPLMTPNGDYDVQLLQFVLCYVTNGAAQYPLQLLQRC